MDIRDWLQNTADREPPDEQDHPSLRFPGGSYPQATSVGAAESVRPRHKRKRVLGEGAGGCSSCDDQRLAVADAASDSHSSDSTTYSPHRNRARGAPGSKNPVEVFERRARHKTRPERYEPKSKKHNREHDLRREKKKKSTLKRRKSRRNGGDNARTTGLVQSFQLNTGNRNSRLTVSLFFKLLGGGQLTGEQLRPDASAGIFKHGRSSVAMPASGPGCKQTHHPSTHICMYTLTEMQCQTWFSMR